MTASERIRAARENNKTSGSALPQTPRETRKSTYDLAVGDLIAGRDIEGVTRTGRVTFATNHHLVIDDNHVVPRERARDAA